MSLTTLLARLSALEHHPRAPGAPLVLYPLEGESAAEALARYGYRPEAVAGRPLILVRYEATHPQEETRP
jgi:hypothetical protein